MRALDAALGETPTRREMSRRVGRFINPGCHPGRVMYLKAVPVQLVEAGWGDRRAVRGARQALTAPAVRPALR